jgi:hypothetical protein
LIRNVSSRMFKAVLMILILAGITVSYSDAQFAYKALGSANSARDELGTVSKKIRALSRSAAATATVLSFDLYPPRDGQIIINASDELPALSSQAVVWAPHQQAFSDLSHAESINRLFKYLYYQNMSPEWLQDELQRGRHDLITGLYGWGRVSDALTADNQAITASEIADTVRQYSQFRESFDQQDARDPIISYVITHEAISPDMSAIDKWYKRGEGEKLGKYFLYKLEPRDH